MERGPEYAASAAKRMLDVAVAFELLTAEKAVRLALYDITISRSTRAGTDGTFEQHKLVLPGENSKLARFGLDELAQGRNILAGDMSVVGHRPLAPTDLEEFLDSLTPREADKYRGIVLSTRPGIFSSYANAVHNNDPITTGPSARYELDMKDVHDGSLPYDVRTIANFARGALRNRISSRLPTQAPSS